MRRRVILLSGALLLTGCTGTAARNDRLEPLPPAENEACWGDYTAGGERNGPFECAGDGVTPIYDRPLPRPAPITEGPIPCPVLQNPGGQPVTYQEPCTRTNVAGGGFRIYDGNGTMIGVGTP